MIGLIRKRKRKAKNKRRKAKESTRRSRTAVMAQAAPLMTAAVTVAQIQALTENPRAKRERRTRKKSPVGITALRASGESRVTERPPLAGAGQQALTPDRRSRKRTLEITDKEEWKGEGAGVEIAVPRTRTLQREVKMEGDAAAGTGRDPPAPGRTRTEAEAARGAGRAEVDRGVRVKTRRTDGRQKEGEAKQLTGGAERGEKNEREEEEVGAEVGIEAKSESKENPNTFKVFFFLALVSF